MLPGPNVVFLLARGAQYGGWSAWRSALGVETATLVLGFATAFGVGALIAASAVAFQVLKWAGVAYLCWLRLRTLRERSAAGDSASRPSDPSALSLRHEAMRGYPGSERFSGPLLALGAQGVASSTVDIGSKPCPW